MGKPKNKFLKINQWALQGKLYWKNQWDIQLKSMASICILIWTIHTSLKTVEKIITEIPKYLQMTWIGFWIPFKNYMQRLQKKEN